MEDDGKEVFVFVSVFIGLQAYALDDISSGVVEIYAMVVAGY